MKMVIIHYAGITDNKASGVSVVVPQIVNNMGNMAEVALYNYSNVDVNIDGSAIQIDNSLYRDDYHSFPGHFSDPDIVVFHSPFGIPKMNKIAKLLKKDNIPYIVVPHGCFANAAMRKKRLKKQIALHFLFRNALANASAVQYLCENEKRDSVLNYKSIVVSNGIEIPEKINREYNTVSTITFIGRKDIHHKGLDILLEACTIAYKELIENGIEVVLYGPGSEEQENFIDDYINNHNIGKVVKNKPGIFGREKEDVLRKSDLFVLTSRYEGQPMAILEALAFSLPVLVTPGTGFQEEVSEHKCGYSVDFGARTLAEALVESVQNKEYLRLASNNAYNYVSSEYCWQNVSQRALNKYKEICYEKNSRI